MRTVKQEFKSVRRLLKHVMNKYPYTRDNDTILYLACLTELGVSNFKEAEVCGLSIISVHKTRQYIQNKEGECLPSDVTRKHRRERQIEIRDLFRECGA